MNAASLYQCSNFVQRHDAKCILDEYSKKLKWNDSYDNDVSLLDIGSGSGDVLVDFILPVLPKNFKKLIGTDISEKMVQYARDTYKNDKIDFEVLDISADELNEKFRGQFNHVTSFYCLHWIQDQQKAIKNIYDALKNDGDCLLVYLQSNPAFDVYKRLSKLPRWSKYMFDVDNFIPKFHYNDNAKLEVTEYFQNAGFKEYSIEVKELLFKYEGTENVKRNNRAINPFVQRMPPNEQDDFMNDYIKTVKIMNLGEPNKDKSDYIYNVEYKLIVAHGRKLNNNNYKKNNFSSVYFQETCINNMKNLNLNDNKIQ